MKMVHKKIHEQRKLKGNREKVLGYLLDLIHKAKEWIAETDTNAFRGKIQSNGRPILLTISRGKAKKRQRQWAFFTTTRFSIDASCFPLFFFLLFYGQKSFEKKGQSSNNDKF